MKRFLIYFFPLPALLSLAVFPAVVGVFTNNNYHSGREYHYGDNLT